jgi:SAM-dependent methyltransferase
MASDDSLRKTVTVTGEPRDDVTERLLRDIRLAECQCVLDVGCGRGDVTLMAARLLGDGAEVVGIDCDAAAVDAAKSRARDLGITNVRFAVLDVGALSPEFGTFDAIIGRRVLMYVPDRPAALRALVSVLVPGGIVGFQEADGSMTPAPPALFPLHLQAHRWIWDTVAREGATTRMGFELPALLASAGLIVEGVRAEAVVELAGLRPFTASIVRMMLPRIVARGVSTAEEIDVDTLDGRLADELARAESPYLGGMAFTAWARKRR